MSNGVYFIGVSLIGAILASANVLALRDWQFWAVLGFIGAVRIFPDEKEQTE